MDYVQGNKGLDAKTPNLPEGKVSVEQIMSLCQALGYFPSGRLYFSCCTHLIIGHAVKG